MKPTVLDNKNNIKIHFLQAVQIKKKLFFKNKNKIKMHHVFAWKEHLRFAAKIMLTFTVHGINMVLRHNRVTRFVIYIFLLYNLVPL